MTPTRINVQPIILSISKYWFKIIQAAIAANTLSKEKIIADGDGAIFFWAYICNVKAIPPDNTPAYIIDTDSFKIFAKDIFSKKKPNKNENEATTSAWSAPKNNGISKILINLPIKIIWRAQKNAHNINKLSPNLTVALEKSLNK